MRVIVERQCDVFIAGERRALFRGQTYDLAPDAARPFIANGDLVEVKAVERAPQNKMVEAGANKRRGRPRKEQ